MAVTPSAEPLAQIKVESRTAFQRDSRLGHDLWTLLVKQAEADGLPKVSTHALARRTGYSHTSFWYILSGQRQASLNLALALASMLGFRIVIDFEGTMATISLWRVDK